MLEEQPKGQFELEIDNTIPLKRFECPEICSGLHGVRDA